MNKKESKAKKWSNRDVLRVTAYFAGFMFFMPLLILILLILTGTNAPEINEFNPAYLLGRVFGISLWFYLIASALAFIRNKRQGF